VNTLQKRLTKGIRASDQQTVGHAGVAFDRINISGFIFSKIKRQEAMETGFRCKFVNECVYLWLGKALKRATHMTYGKEWAIAEVESHPAIDYDREGAYILARNVFLHEIVPV